MKNNLTAICIKISNICTTIEKIKSFHLFWRADNKQQKSYDQNKWELTKIVTQNIHVLVVPLGKTIGRLGKTIRKSSQPETYSCRTLSKASSKNWFLKKRRIQNSVQPILSGKVWNFNKFTTIKKHKKLNEEIRAQLRILIEELGLRNWRFNYL